MGRYPGDLLCELFDYMEWADATVWKAVLARDEALSDGTVGNLLRHLHMVQRAFLLVWRGQPPDVAWSASAISILPELRTWARPYYADARDFVGAAAATESLGRPMVMPWAAHFEQKLGRTLVAPTLAETIFHVGNHSTYHRGQVNARLRVVGGEPPLVDHIAWVWQGKPQAGWE